MAQPLPALPPAETLNALIDARGHLAVRVTPGARAEAVEIVSGRLCVKVRAKPQDGAANDAGRDLLAKALGLAPSRLELLRGATSREKLFGIND